MNLIQAAHHYGSIIELALQRFRYSLRGRFSHSNEQEILADYISRLLPPNRPKTVVDIGAGNGIRWSNSYALLKEGWKVLAVEADAQKYSLLRRSYRGFTSGLTSNTLVSPENVLSLFERFDIERDFSVLCLDIDGNDYWVLDSILSQYRPALVVTEINQNIPPPLRFVVKFDPKFQLRLHFFGYSISALEDLCEKHGYGILQLEYNNAFVAPREIGAAHFSSAEAAYAAGYRERADRSTRFPANADMEELQSLDVDDARQFVKSFFASEAGKYYLADNKESFTRELESLEPVFTK